MTQGNTTFWQFRVRKESRVRILWRWGVLPLSDNHFLFLFGSGFYHLTTLPVFSRQPWQTEHHSNTQPLGKHLCKKIIGISRAGARPGGFFDSGPIWGRSLSRFHGNIVRSMSTHFNNVCMTHSSDRSRVPWSQNSAKQLWQRFPVMFH